MSTDKKVTSDVMKTLEDGKEGFEKAARLLEQDAPTVSATFLRLSRQRNSFYDELQELAKDYGDSIEEDGTVAAALHRGWMKVKDALSGSDAEGVLDAAVQGEEHAVNVYEDALESSDISPELRGVLVRQMGDVVKACSEVTALRAAHTVKAG